MTVFKLNAGSISANCQHYIE